MRTYWRDILHVASILCVVFPEAEGVGLSIFEENWEAKQSPLRTPGQESHHWSMLRSHECWILWCQQGGEEEKPEASPDAQVQPRSPGVLLLHGKEWALVKQQFFSSRVSTTVQAVTCKPKSKLGSLVTACHRMKLQSCTPSHERLQDWLTAQQRYLWDIASGMIAPMSSRSLTVATSKFQIISPSLKLIRRPLGTLQLT